MKSGPTSTTIPAIPRKPDGRLDFPELRKFFLKLPKEDQRALIESMSPQDKKDFAIGAKNVSATNKQECAELKARNQQLDADIQQLDARDQQLDADIQQLDARNQQLDAENQNLALDKKQLAALMERQKTQLYQLETQAVREMSKNLKKLTITTPPRSPSLKLK